MVKEIPSKLYHGTCLVFVAHAVQNEGSFGPDYDRISFTPNLEHALTFAQSWDTARGSQRLRDYFGSELPKIMREPVVLEFLASNLSGLIYHRDCGADEFYVEKGPVNIYSARILQSWPRRKK